MTDAPPVVPTTAIDPLLTAIAAGTTVHDLAQPLENGMPCSPNHPGFRMALLRRHGDGTRPDGSSAANELIVTGGHVGTHIDALSHASHHGRLFGGHDAAAAQQGGRFAVHGIDTVPPMVCRGVLLDVAAAHGTDVLDAGYGITADDLAHAAARAGVLPAEQDVCLVRTGWARRWNDAEAYIGQETGVPGLTESAADWLADRGVRAIGADTTAVERIPPGRGHAVLPVHRTLLVDRGVHLIEHMNLETLAAAGAAEFLFVLSPLKITGGTGSPVRPLAVLTAGAGTAQESR
ncbi:MULTISPECIES: cyclase family protein [Streptomyces]|uniref:cyclase family protein n=1 Tax=Streptomyces TaxID=1883 RepID=UPI000F6F9CFF|nr:cyclase family protein [Streptomyces sp. W1SF4]AZM93641.1 cyclase family protein [Streptomyces sp. W1SF4]